MGFIARRRGKAGEHLDERIDAELTPCNAIRNFFDHSFKLHLSPILLTAE
jgi:hypothetical protein